MAVPPGLPMLCELRTIDLVPRALDEAERRLAAEPRTESDGAELAASFHTEIGPLNQIVQLWRRSAEATGAMRLDDRGRGPAEALGGLVTGVRRELLAPLPFSPPLVASQIGPYYELRRYVGATAGDLERLAAAWEAALPGRLAWGPLAGVWRSAEPAERLWIHLWPYPSLDRRAEIRREVRRAGAWPPGVVARRLGLSLFELVRQENAILLPASFSPLE